MVVFPKNGEPVSIGLLHLSKCNVRYGVPIEKTEENEQLDESLKYNKIHNPIQARPEGDGFHIYVGRGRIKV